MGINLVKLSAQGRAYSSARPWTEEELEAVLLFERERGLSRTTAADHVRNGILDLAAFDKATKAEFKPKTLEEAEKEKEASLKEEGKKFSKSKVKPK